MKRRRYRILNIFAIIATAISLYWVNQQGLSREGVATTSLCSLENRAPVVEAQSRLGSETLHTERRRLNRSGDARSKLAIRDGEIGVVQIPAATMEHLGGNLPSPASKTRVPPEGPRMIGVYNIDSLVSMLSDHELGGACVSASLDAALDRSGGVGIVEVTASDDTTVSLSVEMDSESGSKLRCSLTIAKGSAVLCSWGPDRSGFLFVVGRSELDRSAEQAVPPNGP